MVYNFTNVVKFFIYLSFYRRRVLAGLTYFISLRNSEMLGGKNISDSALEHAKVLLGA